MIHFRVPQRVLPLFIALIALAGSHVTHAESKKPWNIIYIMADDVGYGDLGCFGSTTIKTPNIDKIATQGTKFTAFYAEPVCGPSRTSALTGCYSLRTKDLPRGHKRIAHHPFVDPEEVLTPEVLKPQGYVSAMIGKWDLGGRSRAFANGITPIKHGFDYFYGFDGGGLQYLNNEVSKTQVHPAEFDQKFTDEAIGFIERNKDTPFYIHLCYRTAHIHGPLDATEQFLGSSKWGIYGDSMQEMDFHIGRLLERLKELDLDKNTMVVFTSDNGPWRYFVEDKTRAGTTGGLRGHKTECWEGGVRVPFIVKAPGLVPAARESDALIRMADMQHTFAELAGAQVTTKWKLDGKSLLDLFSGKTEQSPVKYHYYYFEAHLQAVRNERYKLILPRPKAPKWLAYRHVAMHGREDLSDVAAIPEPLLFDLKNDRNETVDIAQHHPEVVKELLAQADHIRQDIGDYNIKGKGTRTTRYWNGDRAKWLDYKRNADGTWPLH